MNQSDVILERLKQGRTITALDAFSDPEIRSLRLGARIFDLKKQGYDIESISVETESGKRISAYRLKARTELF